MGPHGVKKAVRMTRLESIRLLGVLVGVTGVVEVWATNRAVLTLRDLGPLVLFGLGVVGICVGVAFLAGELGRRFFRILKWPEVPGSVAFAALTVGALVWPDGLELFFASALTLGLALRHRIAAQRRRLDGLLMSGLAGAALAFLISRVPPDRPVLFDPEAFPRGVPVPGSVSVTVTVHPNSDFPDVPAVHPPMQWSVATREEKKDMIFAGVIPKRRGRQANQGIRWVNSTSFPMLPEGALWSLARRALPLRSTAQSFDPTESPLALQTVNSGIPFLDSVPDSTDPPLFLRVLELDAEPSRELALQLQKNGLWIDVSIGESEEIALSGVGVRVVASATAVNLLDVTPTALHALGLAVPRSLDGRVLFETFEPAGPLARPPRYRADGNGVGKSREKSSSSTSR